VTFGGAAVLRGLHRIFVRNDQRLQSGIACIPAGRERPVKEAGSPGVVLAVLLHYVLNAGLFAPSDLSHSTHRVLPFSWVLQPSSERAAALGVQPLLYSFLADEDRGIGARIGAVSRHGQVAVFGR
jgi:hypothetical protein